MSKIELLNKLLELTVWLPIKDYPNYQISICGSVRNVKTKRILKPNIIIVITSNNLRPQQNYNLNYLLMNILFLF